MAIQGYCASYRDANWKRLGQATAAEPEAVVEAGPEMEAAAEPAAEPETEPAAAPEPQPEPEPDLKAAEVRVWTRVRVWTIPTYSALPWAC